MRTAAHGATVDFRQGEGRAFGGDDDVRRPGDADAAAQDKTMHRDNHRHRVAVHGLEGGVVTGIDLDDPLRVLVQFLDVDTGAKAPAFGADHDHPHVGIGPKGFDLSRQGLPLLAVEGVDRWFGDHQLGDPLIELCRECRVHRGSPMLAG
ncbi:hypothetical protein D3C87_1408850 [compost metagenome]